MNRALSLFAGILTFAGMARMSPAEFPFETEVTFAGLDNASAAVMLDTDRFLVAGDERNRVVLCSLHQPAAPLKVFDFDAALAPAGDEPAEADLEAAARIGDRVYWIGSHGRDSDGEWRWNRSRFFATVMETNAVGVTLRPVGTPYRDLMTRLLKCKAVADLGLAQAVGEPGRTVKALAPKRAGVNIEGLAASSDGGSLLIGFRNPIPRGRALVIPLLNPAAIVESAVAPLFGDPILLDLQGLGIRDLVCRGGAAGYWILGGPADTTRRFALFSWTGSPSDPPVLRQSLDPVPGCKDFTPEALLPQADGVTLLSDDGSLGKKRHDDFRCVRLRIEP